MRSATVDRASPVMAESSVRVRGRPSRRIWKRSLATEDPRAVTCASSTGGLTSFIVIYSHVRGSKIEHQTRMSRRFPPRFRESGELVEE